MEKATHRAMAPASRGEVALEGELQVVLGNKIGGAMVDMKTFYDKNDLDWMVKMAKGLISPWTF